MCIKKKQQNVHARMGCGLAGETKPWVWFSTPHHLLWKSSCLDLAWFCFCLFFFFNVSHWVYYSVASGSRIIHPVGHLSSNSILLLYFIILFYIIFNLINLENSMLTCGSFYTSLAWKQILNIFLPPFLSLHQIHVSLNCITRMFDVKIAVWVAVLSFIFFLSMLLDWNLDRISNNFWNDPKHTFLPFCAVHLCEVTPSAMITKIKILISSTKCWRHATSCIIKYSVKN